jgi:hypothetical protein
MHGMNNKQLDTGQCVSLLKEWQGFCEEQCILHDMCRGRYKKLNYFFAIPAILLSTVGGTANIGLSGNSCSVDGEQKWLSIVFGSLGLSSAALFTIHRYMNLPELQQQHEFYSGEYAKLLNEIKMQLFIDGSENPTYHNLVEFVKACKQKLDSQIDKAPSIARSIAKKYDMQCKANKRMTTILPSLVLIKNVGRRYRSSEDMPISDDIQV